MQENFSEEARKILKNAKLEMQKLKHPFVGSEHLILSILSFKNLNVTLKLKEYHVTYDNFKKELINTIGIGSSLNHYFIYTPMLKRILENAIINTKEDMVKEVNPGCMFFAILEEGEGVGIRILNNLGVNIDELYEEFLEKNDEEPKRGKNKKRLSVYEYGVDLVELAKSGKLDPVIGREAETERLIEILLRKNKNNPLLLGDAGVGKTAIVENLALKIVNHDVPNELLNKKILSISMSNLVAGTKYRGEFEEKIEKIIHEIESNSNLIIFIDEMHSIVGAGGAEGAIDAANILKPALARGKFKLIGATTTHEYKDTIEKDKALNRRFQTILIEEPTLDETSYILKKIKGVYENFHSVIIPDEIIDSIVKLSNKYILTRKNPDKSIDILDEVCTKRSLIKDKDTIKLESYTEKLKKIEKDKNNYIINGDFEKAFKLKKEEIVIEDKVNKIKIKTKHKKEVKMEDIGEVLKAKTNIPIYEIDKQSGTNLAKLEKELEERIVGQNEAIKKLSHETIKIKLGLKDTNKPISFLFVGKSGVGKTELVKVYAELLHAHLIRIDASEYNESHSISKIIGSPPGYVGFENVSILDEVKNHPNSVILIDEIEKASISFLNLFLQILDEGFITNSSLEKIYFNHTIIIMTSNQTSNVKSIGFNDNKDSLVKKNLKDAFNVEFLNRLDYIINFNDLTNHDIKQIVEKELNKVKNKFKNQNIELVIQKSVVNEIVKMSNYEQYGARQIRKLINEKIDDIVIDNILLDNKKIEINHI